jgi:hypothetical protein
MKASALISAVVLAAGFLLAIPLTQRAGFAALPPSPSHERAALLDNDAIDMKGFLSVADEAAEHRVPRRVTEEEFIQMSLEPGTVILDARSREMFELLHVEGAVNLPFPDIDIQSLAEFLPDKNTRILIYCNNNFENEERAMRRKMAPASLNLSTYISLYTYGYRNVYELGPRKDPRDSKLPLVGTLPEYQEQSLAMR